MPIRFQLMLKLKLWICVCMFLGTTARADIGELPDNMVGITPAKVTPALKKPPTTLPVSYKRRIGADWAVRASGTGNYSSAEGAEKKLDIAVGPERHHRVSDAWLVYYGLDIGYATTRYNGRSDTITRYGLCPVGGAAVFLHRNFSLSSELRLDIFYTMYRDPKSFDKSVNSEDWEVALGGVGSFFMNVHF